MTSTHVPTHVIPWDRMTPRQQAEHLVYVHGFDRDEFTWLAGELGITLTNAEVVEAWLTERFTDESCKDESYPHPEGRTDWHDGDHDGGYCDDVLAGRNRHDHDKKGLTGC